MNSIYFYNLHCIGKIECMIMHSYQYFNAHPYSPAWCVTTRHASRKWCILTHPGTQMTNNNISFALRPFWHDTFKRWSKGKHSSAKWSPQITLDCVGPKKSFRVFCTYIVQNVVVLRPLELVHGDTFFMFVAAFTNDTTKRHFLAFSSILHRYSRFSRITRIVTVYCLHSIDWLTTWAS